jgi:universal stress protein E
LGSMRRILVAVKDPAAGPLPAVMKAVQLAGAWGAHLELFHAIDAPVYVDMLNTAAGRAPAMESDAREQYLQRLGRIAARARLHAADVGVAAEWDFPAYEAIVRRAGESKADLIVAECHAGRHIAPGMLRLADWELLRLAALPVLLVKRSRPYHRPIVLAALDPGHAFAKPARLDAELLRMGAMVAQGLRGELHVVHAYPPLAALQLGLGADAGAAGEEVATAAAAALGRVPAMADVPTERRHLVCGEPAEAVSFVARRLRAAIVVAGAIARSGLERALIGSTAERLLDRLSCDLLIVKPAEFVSRVPRTRRGPRTVAVEPLG